MDAITLLKNDHHDVEQLFKRFEKAGDQAFSTKRGLVDQMIEELSRHAAVEEQLFYPVTRATVPGTEDIVLESIEEHHIVKRVLSELQHLDPHDERFDAKVTVLIENVRHHIEEEETDYFPMVRDELGRKALDDLGDAMSRAKNHAPTHPHPHAPQTPPGNLAAGGIAGAVDRVTDTVSGVAQGSLAAATDLVDRVRGSKTVRPAPTGSSTARSTAQKVRGDSKNILDEVIEAVRSSKATGKQRTAQATSRARKTAAAAETGTKRAAGSARKGARKTVTTAKQAATTTTRAAKTSSKPRKTAAAAKTGTKRATGSARKGARKTVTTAKQAATTTTRAAKTSSKPRKTAAAAKTGTKRAAGSARKGARKTVTTAKQAARTTARAGTRG